MAFSDDLRMEVARIFKESWAETTANDVPEPKNVPLGSNAASLLDEATVMYADLDGSTSMVDTQSWQFCAEIYKTFLLCAAKIIRDENGKITAYDGDRVMAVFYGGDDQNTRSVRAALKINYAVKQIINPAISTQYPQRSFEVKHVVGLDRCKIRAARTGVRGDNDLVWIGRAANYAAKLTDISTTESTWMMPIIYNRINDSVKYANGVNMWKQYGWTAMNGIEIWGSTYYWTGW